MMIPIVEKKLHLVKNNSLLYPPPSKFKRLLTDIAKNRLTDFSLGFEKDEIYSKRCIPKLIKVIQDEYFQSVMRDKYSCLKTIRIGWRLPRYALMPILQQVVPLLLRAPSTRIETVQLALHASIPEATLKNIVSCTTLLILDIRSTGIRTRCQSDPRDNRSSSVSHSYRNHHHHHTSRSRSHNQLQHRHHHHHHHHDDGFFGDDGDNLLVEDSILKIVPHLSNSIHTLKLIDCDLKGYHLEILANYLKKKRNIRSLILRNNRDMCLEDRHGGSWIEDIVNLPFIKSLDLSICDLDVSDGWALTRAMEENPHMMMQDLRLAGNYRMSMAIPQLMQVTATRLIQMDISFCDVQNKVQNQVFEILANTENCKLRSLKMQSARLQNVEPLIQCLLKNHSLERLLLDHPRDPQFMDAENIQKIVNAMPYNFLLSDFRFDYFDRQHQSLVGQMRFWLDLNRCGRHVLLQDNDVEHRTSYGTAMARAVDTNDIDVMYWMLRNGAEQFL